MTQYWTILSIATGEVLAPCFATASAGQHPKDAGWAWDPLTQRATRIAARPDPVVQAFDGTAWVEKPALVGGRLIAKVKAIAAVKKMAAMSPSTSKTEEYRLKAPEIIASANVAAAILNGLTAANAMVQYPAAATEAKLSGEPLATVLARFRRGAGGSNPEVNRLSAIEQVFCRRIEAATTAEAKRDAFTAIDWDWKP